MKLLEYFTPSQPVSDRKRFAGRSDVLSSVIRAIEEQRLHVIVYGERGLGKTSVMHVLTQAAREARYLVVYVSCGADSSFDEVFRTVAAHVPMLFHSTVGPTSPEVEKGKTLAELLTSTPISPRMASDMLAKVVGTRVVVVLDEFDRSHSKEFRQNIAELDQESLRSPGTRADGHCGRCQQPDRASGTYSFDPAQYICPPNAMDAAGRNSGAHQKWRPDVRVEFR